MTHNRPTIPAHMLHGATRYGCIDLPNIVQSIQHEKLKMIQRAQDLNPEAARAVAHLLSRVADFIAIPYTAGGSLTLGLMDDEDLEQYPCWETSATEYLNKAGLALGRKGDEAWGDKSHPLRANTKVPRPITGATLNTIQWLKEFDIMTIGDLVEVPAEIEHTD